MGGYKYLTEIIGMQYDIRGIPNANGSWWYEKFNKYTIESHKI
jgi:hypothetical protein